jgi:phosphatidylserine decarboxylase
MTEGSNTDSSEDAPLDLGQRLFIAMQHALPQHALSNAMFRLTRLRLGVLTTVAIRAFVRAFKVDLSEAADPTPSAYPSFNAFFTRALRDDARPADPRQTALLSPVDGTISQMGRIEGGRIVQAKGRDYSALELLGGGAGLMRQFDGGAFATLYLSPRDYHRVHMPLTGSLRETIQVPGRLFSVNPTTTAAVKRLFARNERLVCIFDTALGPMAMVLVGAIFVGSIETVWGGPVTPPHGRQVICTPAGENRIRLNRGDEMGRFNMGSTVILLLPKDSIVWHPALTSGSKLHCGQALGLWRAPKGPN